MAAYQNLNYISYAAIVIFNYNSFIYLDNDFMINMIILSSVLPYESIDNCDNGRHFFIFFIVFYDYL